MCYIARGGLTRDPCAPLCAASPETLPPYVDVQVGDKVSVLYKINSKKERTIYEAKVSLRSVWSVMGWQLTENGDHR